MKLEAIFSWKRMKGYKDLENQFFWNFAKVQGRCLTGNVH